MTDYYNIDGRFTRRCHQPVVADSLVDPRQFPLVFVVDNVGQEPDFFPEY